MFMKDVCPYKHERTLQLVFPDIDIEFKRTKVLGKALVVSNLILRSKDANFREKLSTIDLIVKVGCFVKKVNNIFNIKSS